VLDECVLLKDKSDLDARMLLFHQYHLLPIGRTKDTLSLNEESLLDYKEVWCVDVLLDYVLGGTLFTGTGSDSFVIIELVVFIHPPFVSGF
jgi:hypothetical protein